MSNPLEKLLELGKLLDATYEPNEVIEFKDKELQGMYERKKKLTALLKESTEALDYSRSRVIAADVNLFRATKHLDNANTDYRMELQKLYQNEGELNEGLEYHDWLLFKEQDYRAANNCYETGLITKKDLYEFLVSELDNKRSNRL